VVGAAGYSGLGGVGPLGTRDGLPSALSDGKTEKQLDDRPVRLRRLVSGGMERGGLFWREAGSAPR